MTSIPTIAIEPIHTDATVMALEPRTAPYKTFLGGGLYVYVTPAGVRSYRFGFKLDEKANVCTLGTAPEMKLAKAREAMRKYRADIAVGVNPNDQRDSRTTTGERVQLRFKEASEQWMDAQVTWGDDYRAQVRRYFENDVWPVIGRLRLEVITPDDCHRALKRITDRGSNDIANDVRGRMSRVFRFHRKNNPVAGLLPAEHEKGHFDRIPERLLPLFVQDVVGSACRPATKLGLLLMLHSVPRTNTFRLLKWSYVDWTPGAEQITVPGTIMKDRRKRNGQMVTPGDYIIPLSTQAVALLRQLQAITGKSEYLFPGDSKEGPYVNKDCFLKALKGLGWHGDFAKDVPQYRPNATIHGFRSIMFTIASQRLCADGLDLRAVDFQLDHKEPNKVRAAYERDDVGGHRGLFLDRRRVMMQRWSDHVDALVAGKVFGQLEMPDKKYAFATPAPQAVQKLVASFHPWASAPATAATSAPMKLAAFNMTPAA